MDLSRLMVLISNTLAMPIPDQVRFVRDSSATLVQYRAKCLDNEDWLREAIAVREALPDVTLIVNDNLEIACEVSDGVHLGDSDTAIDDAINKIPSGFLVGGTCNAIDDIETKGTKCSYLGLGPYKATTTKSNHKQPFLRAGLEARMKAVEDVKIPVYLIGGLTFQDISELAEFRNLSFCISGGVFATANPTSEIDRIIDILA